MFVSPALAAALAAPGPASIAEHQAACAGKDGWSDLAPPILVFGNTYDVGTCGIVVLLVTGPQGHVLIDGATAEAAPGIARNIERLGFRLGDIKLILASHEHADHVGGLAELQRLTGATIRLSPAATKVVASGKVDPADPQVGIIAAPPPAIVGKPLRDREWVEVGPIRLLAHFTPGHAAGGTSWAWRTRCDQQYCPSITYADSLTAVSADRYRFRKHPERVAALMASFDTVDAMPCEILVTPHPGASNLYDRLAGKAPLIDKGTCRAYTGRSQDMLRNRLAKEGAK